MRRLPRGSHLKCLTTFVTYTSLRSMPASSSARSRSLPAGPTKGWPARSSASPGCSPTSITSALRGPSPNTVCVPRLYRSHALHPAATSRTAFRVGRSGSRSLTGSPGFGSRDAGPRRSATELTHRPRDVFLDEWIAARGLVVIFERVGGAGITGVAERDCQVTAQPAHAGALHRAALQ